MPRKPDLPCADCGRILWRATSSLPAGQARCQPCRRANPAPRHRGYPLTCEWCGAAFRGQVPTARFCSVQCCGHMQSRERRRSPEETRALDLDRVRRRRARETAVPGLTRYARKVLLDGWVAEGRACVYCGAAATEVDHIVPLSRGGTNEEPNLAPCCKPCNASKRDKTLSEWGGAVRVGR